MTPMALPAVSAATFGDPVAVSTLVLLSGIVSVALAVVGILAFYRRRSPSYLLVAAALVVLAAKAFVGGLTVAGLLGLRLHHIVEHGLDLLMALLLIGAIYVARSQHRCGMFPDPNDGRSL
jgi:heme A synthase